MKSFSFLKLFIVSLLFLPASFLLTKSVSAEQVDSLEIFYKINTDASLEVVETINYNFAEEQKRGIYRTIPYVYKDKEGQKSQALFANFKVVDNFGSPLKLETSKSNNAWVLKIGDPDILVTGSQTYVLSYTVQDALKYFSDHDELYWDAVGTDWTVPVLKTKVEVSLPQVVEQNSLQHACYYGVYGSATTCVSSLINEGGNKGNFLFTHDQTLEPGSSLTIVAGWPKGVVTEPSFKDKLLEIILTFLPLLFPLIIFFWLLAIWKKTGRDPKGQGTIIAQFGPPKETTPSEVGTIIDERVDHQDLSAEIINLAVLGYLKIARLTKDSIIGKFLSETDYELTKLKEGDSSLSKMQQQFLQDLFKTGSQVKLSEIKNDFYQNTKELQDLLYQAVVDKGYFVANPQKVRRKYLVIGLILMTIGAFILAFLWQIIFSSSFGFFFALVGFGLSGALFFIFSFLMPKKTEQGVLAKEHILGLKLYLTVAEKDRLEFHNAPEKNPEHFEKLLPYAMVLKVEKKWAEQFKELYNYQPKWYSDPSMSSFSTILFINSLNNFTASANNLIAPQNQNSQGIGGGSGFSGGFSGGGGGGGGGGSW